MADQARHVVPLPDGSWGVRKPGAQRLSDKQPTQAAAVDRAREILTNVGGGQLRVHGTDGKIRKADTVPNGNDPFPPRDRT
jgi:hypothetical protein